MPPAVLLLHGFTHTGASWDPVVTALGERYRAITPDIRGHGSASDARPVTLDAVLADLEATPSDRFTLAGYSMGGRIALHLALALPERVERLILIGASPGIAEPAERARRQRSDEALAAEVERLTIEEFAERWAATPLLAGLPGDATARVHEDRLRSTPAGLARALRGLGAGVLPSLWDRLAELTLPLLLVVGERDQKFRATAAQVAEQLPAAQVVVVRAVGHAVHLEAPERVAELIDTSRSASRRGRRRAAPGSTPEKRAADPHAP